MKPARLAPVLLTLLLGCPAVESSGEQKPEEPAQLALERTESERIRRDLQRRLAVVPAGGPAAQAQRKRIESALGLLDKLDRVRDQAGGRASEREALQLYARFLRAVTAAEVVVVEAEGNDPALQHTPLPDLALAARMHESGDALGALAEGVAVLDSLTAQGIESVDLRMLLGAWAIEAGEGEIAEEQYEAVLTRGDADVDAAARTGLRAARQLVLGPEAAGLQAAAEALDAGDLALAWAELEPLERSADPEIVRRAEALGADLRTRATNAATEDLARAEVLLQGPGPWDAVAELLDAAASMPPGSWDPAEHRRLLAWYRGQIADADAGQLDASKAALDARLAEARASIAAGRYREGIEEYRSLDGTSLQRTARREAAASADSYVKVERERAAQLFVAARKGPASGRRTAYEGVRDLLAGLLREFPDSSYARKVADNLAVVEAELAKL